MKETVETIVVAIITSGAFFSFLQFLVTRFDNKKGMEKQIGKLDEKIDAKIDAIDKKFDSKFDAIDGKLSEHRATLARTHILRFADEQRQLVKSGSTHSEEYFKQQILDIDLYNDYCKYHPDFSNGLTVMASEYIRKEYKRVYLDPMIDG